MNLKEKANLIIYRFREKGLEIFLINDEEQWEIPNGKLPQEAPEELVNEDKLIELDPVIQANGEKEEAWAVEGDWHEIPSLKNMLYEDAMQMKDKLKSLDNGAFFAVKEAVKKVLPHQYEFLKELKDTLIERNSTKDM
jgi:predicted NUDIX family NTP pyrophosphohydrolase